MGAAESHNAEEENAVLENAADPGDTSRIQSASAGMMLFDCGQRPGKHDVKQTWQARSLNPGVLPPGWEEKFSSSRQRVYYYEKKTGTSTWFHPNPKRSFRGKPVPPPPTPTAGGFNPFACWEISSSACQNQISESTAAHSMESSTAAHSMESTVADSIESSRATSLSTAHTETQKLSPRTAERMGSDAPDPCAVGGSKMSQSVGAGIASPDLNSDQARFCSNCGENVSFNPNFCPRCGVARPTESARIRYGDAAEIAEGRRIDA